MRISAVPLWAAALVLLDGWALLVPVYEGRYSSAEGWREGKVLEVGAQVGSHRAVLDCRKKATGAPAEELFAYVEYQRGPIKRDRQIVPIRREQDLMPGDLVYVKIWDCSAPVPRRGGVRKGPQ